MKSTQRVIVESPFGAPTPEGVERNLRYLRACMRDCLDRNEAPFASHGLYTQPGVLDDWNPAEREKGILSGFAWRAVAHKTVVYVDLGISGGMRASIANAQRAAQHSSWEHPTEFRFLGGEWSQFAAVEEIKRLINELAPPSVDRPQTISFGDLPQPPPMITPRSPRDTIAQTRGARERAKSHAEGPPPDVLDDLHPVPPELRVPPKALMPAGPVQFTQALAIMCPDCLAVVLHPCVDLITGEHLAHAVHVTRFFTAAKDAITPEDLKRTGVRSRLPSSEISPLPKPVEPIDPNEIPPLIPVPRSDSQITPLPPPPLPAPTPPQILDTSQDEDDLGPITEAEVKALLKQGAEDRAAAEKTLKTNGRY